MSRPADTSGSRWILEHVLALVTLGSFAYAYWLLKSVNLYASIEDIQDMQLSPGIVLAGTLSVIVAAVFWVRMYRDFFRQRPERHAAAWGIALLVGAHLTALVYFVAIWRPRNQPR